MKFDQGMGTLMTVFSGVAALMCLLVGVQLFFLASQIGQAADLPPQDPDLQFLKWKAEARTGAVMSLGAGILIFLFGLRQRMTSDRDSRRKEASPLSAEDLASLSVRVFEVDDLERTVEISAAGEDPGRGAESGKPVAWAPLADLDDDRPADQETQPGGTADFTDFLLRSISEATTPDPGTETRPQDHESRNSLLNRIFRRPKRR